MTLIDITLLFVSGLYIIFFLWGIGSVVISFFRIGEWMSPFQRTFASLTAGLFTSVTTYSLLLSNKLNSISVVISVLFLFWIFLRKKSGVKFLPLKYLSSSLRSGIDLKSMIIMGVVFSLIFLAQLIKLDVFSGNIPTGSLDFPFYITIAEQLNLQGIENVLSYMNEIQGVSIFTAQPYHFFDLWFNALLQKTTFSNPLYVYLFLFVPLIVLLSFGMILFVGTWMLQSFPFVDDAKNPATWLVAVIAFFFLFLIGYFPYSKIGHHGFEWLESPIFNNPKFFYSYLLLGIGIPLFLRKSYLSLVFLFLTVSYCYILYLPIVTLSVLVIILIQGRDFRSKKFYWRVLAFFIFGLSLFVLFYSVQSQEKKMAEITEMNLVVYFKNVISSFSIKSIIIFIRAYGAKVIYFIPFLIMLIWQLRSGVNGLRKIFLTLLVLVLLGGTLSYAFSFHVEGWQFLAQLYGPAVYILFFLVTLIAFCESRHLLKRAVLLLVVAQSFFSVVITLGLFEEYYPTISREFKDQIDQNASSFSAIGLYFISHDSFENSSRNVSPYLNYYTGFLKLVPNTWLLQSSPMSTENLDKLSPEFRSLYLNSPLIEFMKSRNLSFEQGVKEFILINNIHFIVWNNQNDVAYLNDIIDRTIADSKSGYKISFLKQL